MRTADPRIVLGLHRTRPTRALLTAALNLGVTALDTAFNYGSFASHTTLAQYSDLLPEFGISTKVGFFPGGSGGAEHSLAPERLRAAVEQSARELGREPDTVLLHNPERALHHRPPEHGHELLAAACAALARARADGLCRSWGIATWNPAPLLAAYGRDLPVLPVLMVRAGLLVGIATLDAADALTKRWRPTARWGMSPFGGDAGAPVWQRVAAHAFLQDPSASMSPAAAAFRAAYRLPEVSAIAVGTTNPEHLRDLHAALRIPVEDAAVAHYRSLLRERAVVTGVPR
ncbi:aldo/keto reductase [Streptomyces sp. NPDC050610]|uniref:aldo/keto reductase n=1 Tax=Streptomyces sp. NPDC050610 TaxID=3157097 RepID=UPI0034419C23